MIFFQNTCSTGNTLEAIHKKNVLHVCEMDLLQNQIVGRKGEELSALWDKGITFGELYAKRGGKSGFFKDGAIEPF